MFDGKLFLGTFDTSSLLEPLGQFTNGDLLHMSRDEWASQIGYLKVLLQLLLNKTPATARCSPPTPTPTPPSTPPSTR